MNWKGIYGGWIKNYADGSSYLATDIDIRKKKCSWRKSESRNIVSVGMKYGTKIVEIYGPGQYWQSDMFIVNFPFSETKILRRNIQKRIEKEDKYVSVVNTIHPVGLQYLGATISSSLRADLPSNILVVPFGEKDIGKWFTLSIDIEKNKIGYHISKEML